MLPPGLDSKHPNSYGSFTISITSINTYNITEITKIQSHCFGNPNNFCKQIDKPQSVIFKYNICTNLWHFYTYLTDCKNIQLFFITNTKQTFAATIQLKLRPNAFLFTKNKNIDSLFSQNSYLINSSDILDLWDCNKSKVGQARVELQLKFDQVINRVLWQANLIDIQEILIIKAMSPISSSSELKDEPILQKITQKATQKIDSGPNSLRNLETQNIIQRKSTQSIYQAYSREKNSFRDNISSIYQPEQVADQRIMEDQIDRIIAQMQNKPYDSSKYLQEDKIAQKQISPHLNYHNSGLNFKTIVTRSNSQQKNAYQKNKSTQKISKYPPLAKITNPLIRTQMLLTSQKSQSYPENQFNLNNLSNSKSKSLEKGINKSICESKKGMIKLKVHQLMVQRPEPELSLLLKVYINDDQDQFYSTNGIKQGQNYSFASNIKINQKRQIITLKFELIDTFDQKSIFATGVFQLCRLFCLMPTKGVFMVNLISPHKAQISTTIKIQQDQVKHIIPNLKTLRIQLQYEQPLQIVQIYLCLNDFGSNCRSCRYRVPFTKQIIEFTIHQLPSGKHINIFPHNRATKTDKLIIQLWGEGQLIGFAQISLKQLSNTNQQMINCSLDPIYLYDEVRQVKGLRAGAKTKLKVVLCYGTVKQIQSLLSRSLVKNVYAPIEAAKIKVPVQQRLGIYIKQPSQQKQVQIQVDSILQSDQKWTYSKKLSLGLKQQQQLCDQDGEQLQKQTCTKQQQNSNLISENQFMTLAMEERYNSCNKTKIAIQEQNCVQQQNGASQAIQKTIKNYSCLQSQPLKAQANESMSIKLTSVTKKFQQILRQALSDFQDEQMFQTLKQQCEKHLLYNFINEAVFRDILHQIGIGQIKIETLLSDILFVSSEMVNVNVLYDMIYSLILEGQIKERYIQDNRLARYCLECLYNSIKQNAEQFVFDDQLEFSQAKHMFQSAGFKLTMRQFTIIQEYITKLKEDDPAVNYSQVKYQIVRKVQQKHKKIQQKQNYKKSIDKKLYSAYWDQEDDFFIQNINKPSKKQCETNDIKLNQAINSEKNNTLQSNTDSQLKKTVPYCFKNQISKNKQLQFKQGNQNKTRNSFDHIKNQPKYILSIEGFENCIEAVQCHLNIILNSPTLKIIINYKESQVQFYTQRQKNKQTYNYNLTVQNIHYLDGCIQLLQNHKIIARCNFSVMLDVRSVYTLKSVAQSEFCGLLYLYFGQLKL